MTGTPAELAEFLAGIGIEPASLVAYGPLAATRHDSSSDLSVERLPGADDLPADLRVDVAVVDARDCDDVRRVGALLARLRDVHAQRVVVLVAGIARNDLLALRFEPTKHAFEGAEVFLSNAGITDKRRDWNNARHWAHPENFDRYRW